MRLKRFLMAAVLPVLVAGPALAATCLQPAERQAMEARALRSYLMVTALNCQKQSSYNDFVRRNMSELNNADRVMDGYFRRAHGGAGRTRLDQYNTTLANDHSQDGTRAGSFFCRDADPLFQQVMALQPGQLAKFSAERNVMASLDAPNCGAAVAAAPRSAGAARR
jgi:hypothetical protein